MKILLSPLWLSKMTRKLTCSGHHSQKYSILSKNPQMLFWEQGGGTGNTNELTACYHSWKPCLLEMRLSRKNLILFCSSHILHIVKTQRLIVYRREKPVCSCLEKSLIYFLALETRWFELSKTGVSQSLYKEKLETVT